ncbi:hypothetical protein AB0E69_21745 [Kribbella sp. NPDC026611]|uniref:hypothetical protein n=1 Tax=Kribbella sp. NPDC026611 TaxID=3154911 RepID=UPI0033F61F72
MSQPSEGPLWQQGSIVQPWDYLSNLTPQQQQRLEMVLNLDDDQVRRLNRVLSRDPLRERLHRTAANAVAAVNKTVSDTYHRLSEAAVALPGQAHRYALAGRDVAVDAAKATGRAAAGATVATGRAIGDATVATGRAVGDATVATGRAVGGATVATGRAVGGVAAATGRAVGGAAVTAGTAATGAVVATGRAVGGAAAATGRAVGGAAVTAGTAVTGAVVATGGAISDVAVAAGTAMADTAKDVAGAVSRWYDRQKTRVTIMSEGVKATAAQLKFDPNLKDVASRDAKEAGELYSAYATAPDLQGRIAILQAETGRLQQRLETDTAQSAAMVGMLPAGQAAETNAGQLANESQAPNLGEAQRTGPTVEPGKKDGKQL